ncbi:MAG: hypothetical protein K0U38_02290 [Epsilonproteobacteria bacterium]|nr:hypothetical protein [Campylobacterota bacterium]
MRYFIILTTIILNFLSAEVEIIASKTCQVEHTSKSNIKKLFMLKTSSIDGESIKILDSSNKKVYKEFVEKYLKKSPTKIKIYWTRMLFTGKKLPPKKLSLEELSSTDYESNCYLSYVKVGTKPKDWKTVEIK